MNKKLINSILYFLNRMFNIGRISYNLSVYTNTPNYKYCSVNVHFWDETGDKIVDSIFVMIHNEKEFEDAKATINKFLKCNGIILLKN